MQLDEKQKAHIVKQLTSRATVAPVVNVSLSISEDEYTGLLELLEPKEKKE